MNNDRAKPVDIVFGTGIRQDLNPQTAPLGTLVHCDNLEFDQLGRLVRRDGFATMGLTKLSKTNTLALPVRRFSEGPAGERLMFTDQNAHLYFPSLDKQCEAGVDAQRSTVRASLINSQGIVGDESGNIVFADAVGVSTYVVHVYVSAVSGTFNVCSDVIDTTTNARPITRALLGTTPANIQPRLMVSSGSLIVFAVWQSATANTLQYARLNLGTGTLAWGAATNLVTDADFPPVFDVDSSTSGWTLVYGRSAAGHKARIVTYDSTPAATHTFDWLAANGTTAWQPTALAVCGDTFASSKIHVAGYDPAAFKLETLVLSSVLVAAANANLDPGLDHAKPATQMAIARRDATHTQLCFSNYTSTGLSTNPRGHLHCYGVADTAAATRDYIFANYSLGSRFYRDARNGGLFAMARFDDPSGFQNHFLLLDFGTSVAIVGGYGAPVPTLHVGSGRVTLKTDNAFTGIGGMADLSGKQAGLFQFTAALNVGASQFSGNQVQAWTFESLSGKRFLSTPCQGEAVVAGATPLTYDGQRLVELSFYSWPVVGAGSFTPTAVGGIMSQGIYQYRLVYEWTDARGNRHQSPASPAVTVDMSSATYAANTNKVSIVASAFHATRKQVHAPVGGTADEAAPVQVIVYRTTNGGSTFYRLPGGIINNTATALDDATFVDNYLDGLVSTTEPLYTAGGGRGELATTAPPPTLVVTTHAQRLWGVDCENPERIWCTKVVSDGAAPGYNQALQIEIPGAGEIKGLGGQDGKLYGLATNGIYLASYGDGPDNAGGGVFPSPQLITTGANCVEPRSVLVGMDGIYFVGTDQWGTGIFQIRRGDGSPISIGKRVRSELAACPVCRGAVDRVSKARTEFLFVDSDTNPTQAVLLYYHHHYLDNEGIGQWTVARVSNSIALECLGSWNDVSVISDLSSTVGIQTPGTFRDFGSSSPVVMIETCDVRPAGLVGFAQIAGLTLLGTQVVNDPITISGSYDSGFSWPDSFSFAATTETAGQPVLRRFDTPTSKLFSGGALRVRITDPGAGEVLPGTTFFHGISIEVIPLGGNARLDATRRG